MTVRLTAGALRQSPVAAILRLTWLLVGHAVALCSAAWIVLAGAGRPTLADAMLGLAAATVVVARWFEVTRYNGPGIGGESVSVKQFRRFTALVFVEAVLLWSTAHALGWALAR